MSRYVTLAVVLCACIGIAYGAATKIKSFTSFPPEAPEADGMAILNYVAGQDETIVQIIISDFEANRTGFDAYDVILVSPSHAHDSAHLAVLETDQHGNGNIHLTIGAPPFEDEDGDWTDSTVELWINGSTSAPDEKRATGSISS